MIPMVVSHTRTGTHYLCKLMHLNLELPGVTDYEKLHFSHSRVPDCKFVHLYRPVLPVMLSIWRMRERLGIRGDVSFTDMLRIPFNEMPRCTYGGDAFFNGELVQGAVHAPRLFFTTFPQRWLQYTTEFSRKASLNVSYDDAVNRPLRTLARICYEFNVGLKRDIQLVHERVGWWPIGREQPAVTREDLELLEGYQCRLLL